MTSRTMMDGKLNAPVGSASPPLNLSGHLRGTGRAGSWRAWSFQPAQK
jgi:hypothetical protein